MFRKGDVVLLLNIHCYGTVFNYYPTNNVYCVLVNGNSVLLEPSMLRKIKCPT